MSHVCHWSMCHRAQVVRRKMDAMKEERRRQEILMKRREQIREATERYQRLKKNYIPGNGGLYPFAHLSLRFRSVIILSCPGSLFVTLPKTPLLMLANEIAIEECGQPISLQYFV